MDRLVEKIERRTINAEELAAQLGCSSWAIYQAVKDGSCPVPVIRVGRRILFAKAAVDALLGEA